MKLTKYTHACLTLEKDGKKLVIDPGSFSETQQALHDADAILITHEHADHITEEALKSGIPAYGPETIEGITPLKPGNQETIAGFSIKVYGGQHALIHPEIPMIRNNAYFIDEELYVPGDNFTVPPEEVKYLFVPLHAPWSKTQEVVDFAIAVKPQQAFNIHDSLLTENGLGFVETHLKNITQAYGIKYKNLAPDESIEL
ncbi:MAG: MBL fold metallo-hydrolase [Micrococcaceae bacterium]